MSKPVISVEHLTKQYDLGVIGTGTLSRDLNRWWARVRKQPDPYTQIGQRDAFERIGETILALDDVSFQVQQGEALGIIGRNGAGKSTLLKILSRVTAPTSGVVKVKGRIGSLLEVGTGFHPELTGRENVYLNGAILGMKKAEVARKFDEIVDFSGVEKFIDTPVKRYSSGMYVRLAFAVAAHLDPEILIVDEVLAVGDAEFQKKCLGKMKEVGETGRTVLFVSHNLPMIMRLCPKALLLEGGHMKDSGNSEIIIAKYQSVIGVAIRNWSDGNLEIKNLTSKIRVDSIRIVGENAEPEDALEIQKPFQIEVVYELFEEGIEPIIQLGFYDSNNICLFITQDANNQNWKNISRRKGFFKSILRFPGNFFAEGSISVNLTITAKDYVTKYFDEKAVLVFTIIDRTEGDGVRGFYKKRWPGVMRPMLDWEILGL